MRSIAATLTAAIALSLTAASSDAPAMTATDLAQLCGGTDHVSVNACRIYILGVTQGIDVGLRLAGARSPARRPCVPTTVSAQELEATVKQRLAALDATEGARDAAGFIAQVLLAAYPCTKPAAREER